MNAPPSSEHSYVTPEAGEPKVNETSRPVVDAFAGPTLIAVSGVDVSTDHSCIAGVGSTLPAASTARTVNACAPSVTLTMSGELHAANAPLSILHSNVTLPPPGSVPVNDSAGSIVLSSDGGPITSWVSGGVASTFHVCIAGVSSITLPISAETSNVCVPSWTSASNGGTHG